MERPNLPFWYYSGRASVTIDGPVYVLKPDGSIVGSKQPSVIVPRARFWATQRATSHLVSLKLVKRVNPPPEPKVKEMPVAVPSVPPPAAKSEPAPVVATPSEPAPVASSELGASDAVIASDSGEEAAGSTVPEESRSRRRSRRGDRPDEG